MLLISLVSTKWCNSNRLVINFVKFVVSLWLRRDYYRKKSKTLITIRDFFRTPRRNTLRAETFEKLDFAINFTDNNFYNSLGVDSVSSERLMNVVENKKQKNPYSLMPTRLIIIVLVGCVVEIAVQFTD